jgi:PPK2 family polyphosphate:nucleotide phosphotransferase
MTRPIANQYLVPTDGSFNPEQFPTSPPSDAPKDDKCDKKREKHIDALDDLQQQLYAEGHQSVLLVFQAMDAAGKDSTIRALLRGVNPAGCRIHSFKQPSKRELEHDFLWRIHQRTPEKGHIGVFNRSHYEEALVVRVQPEYLGSQKLDLPADLNDLWQQRFAAINQFEQHLSNHGTTIIKFWLNVSPEEQKNRFLSRLEEPEKHYKFSKTDLSERALWDDYMAAYHEIMRHTSTDHAPWYAIPADNKPYMRWQVAKIVRRTLEAMQPAYPTVNDADKAEFEQHKQDLITEK